MQFISNRPPEDVKGFADLVRHTHGFPNEPGNDDPDFMHQTEDITFICGSEKPLTVEVFEEDIEVPAGTGFFINAHVLYHVKPAADNDYYTVTLPRKLISFYPNSYLETHYVLLLLRDEQLPCFQLYPEDPLDQQLLSQLQDIIDIYYSLDMTTIIYRLAVACVSAYATFLRLIPDTSDEPVGDERHRILEIIQYLQDNCAEHVTQMDLISVSGLRLQVLDQLFGKYVRSSPIRYMIRYRLYTAAGLLKKTGLSISEISERVGFHSPSSFIVQFKKEYQRTPKEFRKAYLNEIGQYN